MCFTFVKLQRKENKYVAMFYRTDTTNYRSYESYKKIAKTTYNSGCQFSSDFLKRYAKHYRKIGCGYS